MWNQRFFNLFLIFILYDLSVNEKKCSTHHGSKGDMRPTHIKRLQEQAKDLRARVISHDTVIVQSVSNAVANHVVTVEFGPDNTVRARCTCPWAINGSIGCSHVLAALDALASKKGRALSFWLSDEEAKRQKHRRFFLKGNGKDGIWITSRSDPQTETA